MVLGSAFCAGCAEAWRWHAGAGTEGGLLSEEKAGVSGSCAVADFRPATHAITPTMWVAVLLWNYATGPRLRRCDGDGGAFAVYGAVVCSSVITKSKSSIYYNTLKPHILKVEVVIFLSRMWLCRPAGVVIGHSQPVHEIELPA